MITKYLKKMIPAAAVVLSFGVTSCVGDLDVTPIDPSTNMTADANGLFNKCYANLGIVGQKGANGGDVDIQGLDGGTTSLIRQLFNANELPTDESICCWGDEGVSAFNYGQWTASHPMLRGLYYRLYFGISVCNQYLATNEGHDATMTAEVRFLRALYYYYLMDCYGNVPFTTVISSENPEQISRADLYAWIEDELVNKCLPDMSEPTAKTSASEGYGRADKAAAWMLLSRLYLNAEVYTGTPQWQKAADYAKLVIDSPHKLFTEGNGTYSAYRMMFMGDNGENGSSVEALLPVLQDGVKTTDWGASMFMIAGTFKSDETPGRGTTETWAGNRARKEFVEKFFPNDNCPSGTTAEILAAAGDDRALLYSKGRKLDISDVGEFTDGYTVSKFTNVYASGGTSHSSQFVDTDFFLMRSAEAYLTYAEATARLAGTGNTTPEGTAYVNELRTRAHAATQSVYSLDQLCDEWSREFYYEGRRRMDLIRFGKFGGNSDYRWQWKGGTMAGTNFDSHYNLFAIPETDLNANSNLKQNPGF